MANCDKLEECPAYNTKGLLNSNYINHHCKLRGENTGSTRQDCKIYQLMEKYKKLENLIEEYARKIKNEF